MIRIRLLHHAHSDVPLYVRKRPDHSGPDDGQRRAADNLPQQLIGLLPSANAEWVNIYVESHRYLPPPKIRGAGFQPAHALVIHYAGSPSARGQVGNLPHKFSLFLGAVKEDTIDSPQK
jgi:hypothetical protein